MLGGSCFFRVISLGRVVVLSLKIVINLPGSMRSYPVKENNTGSAVSEIIRYKHTDKHTDKQIDILLLYYKDSFH